MMECLRESNPRARKVYWCYLCGCNIEVGTIHHAAVMADSGQIWTNREHLECEAKFWGYVKWVGCEPRDVDEDFHVDTANFREYLEQTKRGDQCLTPSHPARSTHAQG